MTKSELERLVDCFMAWVGMEIDDDGELTVFKGQEFIANTPMRRRLKKLALKYCTEQEEEEECSRKEDSSHLK